MNKIINYLGVDWGEKRIGLATADSDTKLSLPLKTVNGFSDLLEVIKKEEIDIVVLGLPRKMSGAAADNPDWLKFFNKLKEKSLVPIEVFDERLSSLAADALFGAKNEKANRDEIAAAIILQDYLEKNI